VNTPPDELVIDSVTGIDVALPVAGAGARALAFLGDWHIRIVLALAWYVAAGIIYNGRLSLIAPGGNEPAWIGAVVAPPFAIYFLYHPLVEIVMRGRTPGKRWAGVRIVARDGGVPGIGPLLVRNVFRLIDSMPLFYGVGLMLTVLTREHVRVGDMAAGTLLVYEGGHAALPVAAAAAGVDAPLDPVGLELAAELLERWPELTPAARVQLAQRLLIRHVTGIVPGSDEGALRAQLQQLVRAPA
jgi:uncharacterized RDD family membrane protein YckC